ncbi:MAG: DUF1549 domain-containing protein, partial [Planctomycetaceae bacterium]|nr:DUF1549 domain-containing protein [Planctomycetaceae bacterium]
MSLRVGFLISMLSLVVVAQADDDDGNRFFETHIRPVLIQHCYQCHSLEADAVKGGLLLDTASGLTTGGDSGPAILPGKPDESPLLEALRYETYEMPPSGKLSDEVIHRFEQWIAMGAPDPRSDSPHTPHLKEMGVNLEKGREFWSFQPVESRVIPEVQDRSWPKTWIDHFVQAKRESSGLGVVETADRATILRRLSYDLIGLPPSPEDLEHFLYVNDPRLIEKYVDKLLESPRFGEHWGRHWLDVARYSDSNGGDFN